MSCFEDIENDTPSLSLQIEDESFEKAERIVLGKKDKYMALATKTQILIYSLCDGTFGHLLIDYKINLEFFDQIYDIILG